MLLPGKILALCCDDTTSKIHTQRVQGPYRCVPSGTANALFRMHSGSDSECLISFALLFLAWEKLNLETHAFLMTGVLWSAENSSVIFKNVWHSGNNIFLVLFSSILLNQRETIQQLWLSFILSKNLTRSGAGVFTDVLLSHRKGYDVVS